MKKIFSLIAVLALSSISTLSSIACDSRIYFDDRTPIQLEDAKFILGDSLKYNLNPNKHVLLIGFDGLPFANLDSEMVKSSAFHSNYYIQGYETVRGWTSVLWGNILQREKTIFRIIKENAPNLKTANITQWMSPYFFDKVYGIETAKYFDYNLDYSHESGTNNYDTVKKLQAQIEKLKVATAAKVSENYNFIFAYNTYYDELKHKQPDKDNLFFALIEAYKNFVTYFYNNLNSEEWLIIVTTDHGRENTSSNSDHPDVLSSHFSWTLSNNLLSTILEHAYTNFYDIRTAVIKWLMN